MPNANSNEEAVIRLNNEINKAFSENPNADVGEIVREAAGLTVGHAGSVPFAAPAPGAGVPSAGKSVEMPALTVQAILDRMDAIRKDTAHIHGAVEGLKSMPQSSALAEVVAAREETNQKMLSILEKMYDDLRPTPRPETMSERMARLHHFAQTISYLPEDDAADLLATVADRLFEQE